MSPTLVRTVVGRRSQKSALTFCCAVLLLAGTGRQAKAGFVGYYALGSFTPANSSEPWSCDGTYGNFILTESVGLFPNGCVASPDPNTIVLTGTNDGSGIPGTTDLTIPSEGSGLFQFNYMFNTLDAPTFEYAGYILGKNFLPLADTNGESGSVVVPVLSGQIIGFRVGSLDNTGSPGVLTVEDFSAPVPEPSGMALLLFVVSAGSIALRLRAIRFSRRAAAFIAAMGVAATWITPPALAQQIYYSGTNVSGALTLSNVVNLRQQAQVPLGAAKLLVQLGAEKLKTLPRLHPPRGAKKLIAAAVAPPPIQGSTFVSASGISGFSALSHYDQRNADGGNQFSVEPPTRNIAVGNGYVLEDVNDAVQIQGLTVVSASGVSGFNALSHYDQRNADGGNQFSIEPPNQSIAVGNGYVLEGVNDAVQIYSTSGVPTLPLVLAANQVFGLAPAINRTTGVNGVYLTDMRVFFDQDIARWFVVMRSQDNDAAGNPLNSSHLYVAVSQTSDPTASYNIYLMNTTNASHIGCPCIDDYPQIGADQYGFHIAWNEYNAASLQFLDATILTLSKASLADGVGLPTAFQFLLPYTTGFEFAIQPATTPPGAANFVASGGLEYFVSTSSTFAQNSQIALWAMYNTSSLATLIPSVALTRITVSTLTYNSPTVASQPPGFMPLGTSQGVPIEALDGGDSRVQALSYAGGRLYLTFPAEVTDQNGHFVVGGAYIVLSPTYRGGVLSAQILNQGYLVVNGNHLLRPAIAVNPQGTGAIAVTLVGSAGNYYPSAAFIPFQTFSTPTTLQIAAPGAFPEDGFTGYPIGNGDGVARWGDYNTAVATSDGSIWMVVQYIGNYPRTTYANWNTYIIQQP